MKPLKIGFFFCFSFSPALIWADFGIKSQTEVHAKYQNLSFGLQDVQVYDRLEGAIMLPKSWQLYLRLDIPYMRLWGERKELVSVGDDGIIVPPETEGARMQMKMVSLNERGLADLVTRAFFVTPAVDSAARVTLGFGSELGFPSAQEIDLGTGKFWARPLVGFRWDFPHLGKGAWFALLAKYQFSFAGDPDRPSFQIFFVQPVFVFPFSSWAFVTAPELQYSIEQKAWFIPASISLTKLWGDHFSSTISYQKGVVDDFPVFEDEVEFILRYAF